MEENPFGSNPDTNAADSDIDEIFEMMTDGTDGIDPSEHLHPTLLEVDLDAQYATTIGIQTSSAGDVLLYIGDSAFQLPAAALPDVINELISAAYTSRSALADELQLSVDDLPQVYEWSEDLLISRYRGDLRGGEYQLPSVFLDDDEYDEKTQAQLVTLIESSFTSIISFDAVGREPDIISVHVNNNTHVLRTSDAFTLAADLTLLQCGLSQTNCTHLDPIVSLDAFPDNMRTAIESEYDDIANDLEVIPFESDEREYSADNPHERLSTETDRDTRNIPDDNDDDESVNIDIDFEP